MSRPRPVPGTGNPWPIGMSWQVDGHWCEAVRYDCAGDLRSLLNVKHVYRVWIDGVHQGWEMTIGDARALVERRLAE